MKIQSESLLLRITLLSILCANFAPSQSGAMERNSDGRALVSFEDGLTEGHLRLLRVYEMTPPRGSIPYGIKVLVDDMACPEGRIKQVTGGSITLARPRYIECIVRPPGLARVGRSSSPPVFLREPAAGSLRLGAIVLVDDDSCSPSQLKRVTGGSLSKGIPRQSLCISRRVR